MWGSSTRIWTKFDDVWCTTLSNCQLPASIGGTNKITSSTAMTCWRKGAGKLRLSNWTPPEKISIFPCLDLLLQIEAKQSVLLHLACFSVTAVIFLEVENLSPSLQRGDKFQAAGNGNKKKWLLNPDNFWWPFQKDTWTDFLKATLNHTGSNQFNKVYQSLGMVCLAMLLQYQTIRICNISRTWI